ncbi:glycerol-3-phosphate dehydrogenase [Ruegeria sp. ANG-S4]|uniref:NAD(P)/FAD-dependent oxidoreductase n=1 Tax=Ruegeria sp. ANG-S4 TaxID=1577904 RepID=UPI00057C85FF|nr:FAD-dependent oxidoreductase [Ruegeria sp. ANG-S4]KIC43576.1 glycerol-3-phosphate dehydrogenase [Ruegeria sp. ANG-S4]
MIDFLVIGGGIAGISAAARLSKHGSVTVLEAEDALGYHASGRSAAMFEENYGPPSVVALNKAGARYLFSENGGYLSRRGLMLLASRDQADQFDDDVKDLNMQGITVVEARACVPIIDRGSVAFAAVGEAAFDIDTDRLLQDFARVIRAGGGSVLTGRKVTGIRKNEHWTVEADGTFEARIIVNAAGAWVDEVAALAGIAGIGITPCRRSMARLPAPGGHDVTTWPMLLGAGDSWYAKPDAGKLLVSPSEADPVTPHDAYSDDMVLAEGLARYEAMVTEPVIRVETSWAGLRSFVSDGTLVLGPDPADASFVWSAGQGGYGFQTAPAASQLVADLVVGAQPDLDPKDIAALRPDRLRR